MSQEAYIGEAPPDAPWPLAARNLLTERERSFYQCLLGLYPEHKIFVQVALSQLIAVSRDHPERYSIRNRYSQLVADFVLCRSDLSIVTVIELDDRSHFWPKRQRADARKNKALADAGIRLVRIPAGALPSEDTLRGLIDGLGVGQNAAVEPVSRLAENAQTCEAEIPSMNRRNDSRAESGVLRSRLLKAGFGGVLLVVGLFVYTHFLPSMIRMAFEPLAVRHSAVAASVRGLPTMAPQRIPSASVAVRAAVDELADRNRVEMQAAAAKREKELAWRAFYRTPASCEHPVDWTAQVECGNQYMRAKKVFEARWMSAHPGAEGNVGAVVLDNAAIGGGHR